MPRGLVTIFGGSGFVGRYAARALVEAGWQVRVACRNVSTAQDVKLAGAPGWVEIVQANLRNEASIDRALDGVDAVVNLVGILSEKGAQSYEATQRDGAENLAKCVARAGIGRFVQVSAISADTGSASNYGRTKGEAEALVREHVPSATILRPSVIFGSEDGFFNKFAAMTSFSPVLPTIGGGRTKLQPIYAGDVAEAIAQAVDRDDTAGKTYELGGPRTYTLSEIYDTIFEMVDRRRGKVPLPFWVAKPMGILAGVTWRYIPPFCWGFLGDPPITGDQVEMLKTDNVVAEGALTAADLGLVHLETVEAIVPGYLWRFRDYGEFHTPSKA